MPVDDLISSLDLEPIDEQRYRGRNVSLGERGVVFGGQLIAQIAVAGARSVPDKHLKSAHAVFGKPVTVDDDTEIVVDLLHAGRAFASASVAIRQNGRDCARGIVLMTAREPDLIRYSVPAPEVERPELSIVRPDPLPDREMRIVGGADIDTIEVDGPPELDVWMSLRPGGDAVARSGLLAHATAGFLIGATMRPHQGFGQSIAHTGISTGIISHTISFHDDPPPEGWILLHQENIFAGHGRAFGMGHAFDDDGRVIASFSQESMIRSFAEGVTPAGKERTIL